MTSSNFRDFRHPTSPCQYQIHATSLPFVRIWPTTSLPLSADVICTSSLALKDWAAQKQQATGNRHLSLPSSSILNSKAFGGECCKQAKRERMPGRSPQPRQFSCRRLPLAQTEWMTTPQKGGGGGKGRHRKSISQGVKASKIHPNTGR